jgi:hypothetical protein
VSHTELLPKPEPPRRLEMFTGAGRRQWTFEQKARLSRELRSIVLSPCPRQEFVKARGGPEIHEFAENVGQISLGVDSLKFCRLDRRCKASPIGCAFIVSGEETGTGVHCLPVSSLARAAAVGSTWSTPAAIRGHSTGATSRTCSWAGGVASVSAASISTR